MRLPPSQEFTVLWENLGGPPLTPEFKFSPTRKWRADYAIPEADLLIEIEGGTWVRGRHVRPEGYAKDAAKYNAAALMGYKVIRFTPDMLTPENLQPVIDHCWDRL